MRQNSIRFGSARKLWLWLYIGANLAGFGWMFLSGIYIGDFAGLPVSNYWGLFVALILTLCSYWLILGPIFRGFDHITRRTKTIRQIQRRHWQLGWFVGIVLFLLQIGFFLFGRIYGVGVAGSTARAENFISLVFALLPVDALFFVYYGIYRSHPMFKWNIGIWALSNMYRGWSGWIFIIIFYEIARLYRKGNLSIKKIALVTAFVLPAAPIIYIIKLSIRGVGEFTGNGNSILSLLQSSVEEGGFVRLIVGGVVHLIGRLQTVTDLSFVLNLNRELQSSFAQGAFAGFWREGLIGAAYDRVMSLPPPDVLSGLLPVYAGVIPFNEAGGWNVNTGFSSWFFIAPEYAILYILYVLILCGISIVLIKTASSAPLALDGLWFAWLIYLLPPWFGPFTGYIWAIGIFLILQLLGVAFYALMPHSHRLERAWNRPSLWLRPRMGNTHSS